MKLRNYSLLTLLAAATSAEAVVVTLDATADHSGLVRNTDNAVGQYGRADTLWGTADGGIGQRRNGLVQFASLDPAIQSGITNGTVIVNSVTLELWNTTNNWNSTTLLFSRLAAGNTDWATLNGPDNGGNGVSSWSDKIESSGTDWASSTGAGNNNVGTAGQQVFGSLTSSYTVGGGSAIGDTKFTVPLSGSELNDWLSDPSAAPNLLVTWDSSAGDASAAQTRFATINTQASQEFAPNLVVDYTVIPEPSSMALLALGSMMTLRRRRTL
ncbi:PEP-CTERM sorting domain-containing protein [Roseibacillus persicicus]|uniref:PEP-CTERM sorting domain-containing protein n=1 Tax=Roseibacillus persicicus TaxID=454148 RepID=UPI00280D9C4C|nr:PEP-CTERM sorting domain-containing protein [Roseibacillus persicicus]MDQ8189159.1 PEP-CTERM sorting domain-containing protein [Roseibacillus persicicus]